MTLTHMRCTDCGCKGNTAKVTLYMQHGAPSTSAAVDQIALGFVSGSGSACGNAGDAQQSAAFPVPSPQRGFDARHPALGPLSIAGVRVPKRLGVAASAAFGPSGPWSAGGGDPYHGSDFRVRCWSAGDLACHNSETGQANSSD